MEHYLDNAATTKTCKEAVDSALFVMENLYGNPSSTHTKGREAKKHLESCRKIISDALGSKSNELYFTSCGTESDNWAIVNGAEAMRRYGNHIISSTVEHDAVRKSLDLLESRGYKVTRLKPDEKGEVSPEKVIDCLTDNTIMVSLMMVNNETGAINDIKTISQLVKNVNHRCLIHTDAVQGFLKVNFKACDIGADLISISGHKIHAVKGIGALYIKNGLNIKPFICGGSQENGLRAGTEALPQIAAFSAACSLNPEIEKIYSLKKYAISELTSNIPELKYLDTPAPHILSISMPGWKSEVLMNLLESREIYVSKSSACKQGRRSHVLEEIGLPTNVIDGALRIGFSRYNSKEDIDSLVRALIEAKKLRHN